MKLKPITTCFIFVLLLGITLSFFSSPSWAQGKDPQKVYKVAILPFVIHSQENLDYLREGIYDILTSRMSDERITVLDRSLVERALYEERPMRLDEQVATKIGTKVGADYIILGSLTKVGDYISLDSRLLCLTEDKPPLGVFTQTKGIDDAMTKIGDFAQDIGNKILGRRTMTGRAQPGSRSSNILREPKLDTEGFRRSQVFNFEVRGLDIGDVDGDGKNEVVIMDRNSLYVFRYDGEKLSLFQKIEAGYEYDFLTLDVADVNHNGHAEIIVTAVVGDDLRSLILEFEEGKFRKIAEKSGWFFRVLEHPKEGAVLVGQVMSSEGIPSGPIYKMAWKKKTYEKGAKIPFPKNTNIFGIAMGDVRGIGKPDYVYFDQYEHLNIATEDGKEVWRGRERFGGTNNFYDTKKKQVEAYHQGESPPWRVYLPGRILVKDLEGQGVPQIIVNKNEFASGMIWERVKSYEKAEIYNLIWEDNRLQTNWKTKEIKGYIADYQVKEVGTRGEEELVLAVNLVEEGTSGPSGLLSRKQESSIFFLKLR